MPGFALLDDLSIRSVAFSAGSVNPPGVLSRLDFGPAARLVPRTLRPSLWPGPADPRRVAVLGCFSEGSALLSLDLKSSLRDILECLRTATAKTCAHPERGAKLEVMGTRP